MEGSHSVSSGPAQQDDSWTCQRCGWVYPNAHPSAKHRRNHKKHCGKIKGFKLQSEPHKGGSSDEASSGDDSHAQKVTPQSTTIEAGSAAPAVEHLNAPQSRDLLVTELNVPDKGNSHTAFPQGTSAPGDGKPEVTDNESTQDIINIDTVKTESSAPEPEPNIVSLDKTSKTPEEGKIMYKTPTDRVEESACILPGLYTDEAKESVEKDIEHEDPPVDLTTSKTSRSVEQQSKLHMPEVDRMEAIANDPTRLDSDQASSANKSGAKSEGFHPKNTANIASLGEPLKTSQDETKVALTPSLDKVEIAAHESQGLDSDHVKAKERLSISKEHGLNKQGSSQDDDSWTCRRCGWVYPNPHPSAKHRKKHKKQCGKIKGFELHTEPHDGGSSDEVSSDEDVHVKKEHVPHQPPLLQAQEKANETVATESLPPIMDHPATSVEGEVITESVSNSLQHKEFSAQVDAPEREQGGTPNVEDIATPDTVPSVVPELSQNVSSLDQQNLLPGDNKTDVSNEPDTLITKETPKHLSKKEETLSNQGVQYYSDIINVPSLNQQNLPAGENKKDVLDEPDTLITKESPKHLSMKEKTFSNQATVEEVSESSETQCSAVPCLPKSVDSSASEGHGNLEKDSNVKRESTLASLASEGHGYLEKDSNVVQESTTESAKEPAGLTGECAPNVASIPSVSDLKPLDSYPPVHVEDKGASVLKVDEPSAVVTSARDPTGVGLSNETLDASARECLNQNVTLKEAREKSGSSVLDTASNMDALDDTMVNEPLRKEMGDTLTGGSYDQLEAEIISSDLSSPTLPADTVPDEKKLLTENLLPVMASTTADVTCLSNDANEERRLLSVQASANPVQLLPKNELSSQIVEGGTDDAFLSTRDKTHETIPVTNMEHVLDNRRAPTIYKTEETPPVVNMEHLLDNQTAVGVAEVDFPKEVNISAATTGEAIQKNIEESAFNNVSSVPEGSSQGETGGTETTNTTICVTKDVGVADIAKESGVERMTEGISSLKDCEEEKIEASVALKVTPKPEAKAETPSETGTIGSSDLSYTETYSFARSESGVTARSELGASSHKLSDSLEIYEDAQDSLETCSVGGSVDENESIDEPRQALDRLQEDSKLLGVASLDERVPVEGVTSIAEPKNLGTASLDEGLPGESVAVEQKPFVSNGARLGEASLEERAPSLPGTSYGGRNEMEDLKAPSPEAWQEPGPSNVKSEGKGKKISTSEVTEDSKSGESHTALRSLMAKEGPVEADPIVETSTAAENVQSSGRKDGSFTSANGTKPKSRSFWRHCICCSTVH